jgi:WhiB family redox-sensing transcriptional regulator
MSTQVSIEIRHDEDLTEEEEARAAFRALAACNDGTGQLTELFFSEDLYDIARAKHICSGCPVQEACLQGALERREPWGVWGGELFLNGRVLAHKRRRGRPPKRRDAEFLVIDGVEVLVAPAIA